jgi:hypothetical protein
MRAVNFNHRPNFGRLTVAVWTNAFGRCVGSGYGSSSDGRLLRFAAVIVLDYMSPRCVSVGIDGGKRLAYFSLAKG